MGKLFNGYFNELERLFFSKPLFELQESLDENTEGSETEEFEVVKGDYKTVITVKFNKRGYPISYGYETTAISAENQLNLVKLEDELKQAVKSEDYELAANLKKQIQGIKTNQQ